MKKIVSMLIVAVLFVSCMIPAVFAADSVTVSVTPDGQEVATGDTVTVTVSISEASISGYLMTLNYDKAALELQSIKEVVNMGGFFGNAKNGMVTDQAMLGSVKSGALFTATFKVIATEPGTYPISVNVNNVVNAWMNDEGMAESEQLDVSVDAGSVVIPCNHVWGEWVETTPATCTAEGVETATCSVCGETKTQAVAALGHTWGEWVVTTAPACEVEGVETATCSVCGETKTQAVAALEHQWGEWVTVKEAAIGVTGLMERTCSVCGEVQQQTIPALADPDLDDVPQTGDITMQLTAGIATVVVALFAGVAFVFKRKTVK